MYPVSCTDTCHNVTNLVNHGVLENKITFLQNVQNLGRHNLVNKNYNTHTCPITHEVKTTRQ